MALQDLALSVLTFPQEWNGAELSFNVLFLPATDDIKTPLTPTGPAFSGTVFTLEAVLVTDLNPLPDPAQAVLRAAPTILTPFDPVNAAALFDKLAAALPIAPRVRTAMDDVRVNKSLPPSYLQAAAAGAAAAATASDAEFGCGIRNKDPGAGAAPPPKQVSWGQVISYALRQPTLAQALGLVYRATVAIDPKLLADGAWFYADFAAGANPFAGDVAVNPDLVRQFAARLPPLAATPRSLFAANLFPVGLTVPNPEPYVEAGLEADTYADGFARVVHCSQPDSVDAMVGDAPQAAPGTDAGIQIGWDDDQVTIWHNRQLDAARARRNPALVAVPIALGVLGYRVDVRPQGAAGWTSLESARATISFDPSVDGAFDVEPPVEPATVRALAGDTQPWLPRYFAQWRGRSLVVTDPIPYLLTAGSAPLAASLLTSTVPDGLLRYGNQYEFRVRMTDLTYGGPAVGDDIVRTPAASIAACRFRRCVPPKALRLSPQPAAEAGALASVAVWRPILGYPELVFAGIDPGVADTLAADAAAAKADNRILGVNDPDVTALRVTVEVRVPAHDSTEPATLDGPFRILYELDVPLPAAPQDPIAHTPPDPADALTLNFDYQDQADIAVMTAPALDGGNVQTLPIPRARDARVRLKPIATSDNPQYFGAAADTRGIETHLDTRSDLGAVEVALLDTTGLPADRLRAFFFQPADNIADLLAQRLGLQHAGLTFHGPAGVRTVFGCSGALRHQLAGDHSSIAFATQTELLAQWIIGIRLTLNRDWTWDGLAARSFDVLRDGVVVGSIDLRRTVGDDAVAASPDGNPRGSSTLVFFDAISPDPAAGAFPVAPQPTWTVQPNLRPGITTPDVPLTLSLRLPKAARPAQTPQLASAGMALSPYLPADNYSRTLPRRRALWLEFVDPVLDPDDGYFARVIGFGPDPLLAGDVQLPDPPVPPLPIDPEPVRMVVPGESYDRAGLDAMQPLVKASDSDRHYLLPLPPGVNAEALDMFGFWTYELAVGHAGDGDDKWSTAQARFGRPLRVTGVQHPAPALVCSASRTADGLKASAPLAMPVLNGRQLLSRRNPPKTQMWFLLYAQAMQADGATWLLLRQIGAMAPQPPAPDINFNTRDVLVSAEFPETAGAQTIQAALTGLNLPPDSPLSVLAVELLPTNSQLTDPLGIELGQQRILRVSPLTPVQALC
jgi:hypothetical protein